MSTNNIKTEENVDYDIDMSDNNNTDDKIVESNITDVQIIESNNVKLNKHSPLELIEAVYEQNVLGTFPALNIRDKSTNNITENENVEYAIDISDEIITEDENVDYSMDVSDTTITEGKMSTTLFQNHY